MSAFIDLVGQKFGRWTVLERAPNKSKSVYWVCQCDCGTIRQVKAASLKSGKSQSCGCLQKDLLANRGPEYKEKKIIHLEGQKFGDLEVLELVGLDDRKKAIWKCKCSCGKIIDVKAWQLSSGKKTNCGCKKTISRGENKIRDLLLSNNLFFIQQASTELNCKYPDTKISARFDFYVNNSYIIEYDGEAHFEENIGRGWITEDNYLYTKKHDQYKNEWCKNNNIPLIRIPYIHYKDLCLEDLLPETSQFLVK